MSGQRHETERLDPGPAMIRVATAVGEIILKARAATGATASQVQVLRLAANGAGMTDIASGMKWPKSTATSVVDQLVVAGLAARSTDERDGRRQVVSTTPAGAAILDEFDRSITGRVGELTRVLPIEHRRRLAVLLAKLPDPTRPLPLS